MKNQTKVLFEYKKEEMGMAQTAAFRYTVPSVDGEGWGIFLLD